MKINGDEPQDHVEAINAPINSQFEGNSEVAQQPVVPPGHLTPLSSPQVVEKLRVIRDAAAWLLALAEQETPQHVSDMGASPRPLGTRPGWPIGSTLGSLEPPLRLDDLDPRVLRNVVETLPEIFDTYHVVEHSAFRRAHADLMDRPAINQLTGKALRRNARALGLEYVGQQGRRRSALWRRIDGQGGMR